MQIEFGGLDPTIAGSPARLQWQAHAGLPQCLGPQAADDDLEPVLIELVGLYAQGSAEFGVAADLAGPSDQAPQELAFVGGQHDVPPVGSEQRGTGGAELPAQFAGEIGG